MESFDVKTFEDVLGYVKNCSNTFYKIKMSMAYFVGIYGWGFVCFFSAMNS